MEDMTSRQAINLLKGLEQSLDDYCELNDEGKAAFRMAITALELFGNAEQLPSAQPETHDKRMETHACDLISRAAAIDAFLAVTGNSSVRELYEHVQEHGLSDMWSGGVNAAIDIIIAVPSAQPERTEYIPDTKAVPSKRDCVDLAERVTATFYDQEHEEWTQKSVTIADVLDSVCDDYTILPSTYPDLSEYSDKLWRNAYERGRAEAQDEKARCKDVELKNGKTVKIYRTVFETSDYALSEESVDWCQKAMDRKTEDSECLNT